MAVYTHLNTSDIDALAREFGVGPVTHCEGVARGTVNTLYKIDGGDGSYLLRVEEVKDGPALEWELRLSEYLHAHTLPTPQLQRTREGALYARYRDRPVTLHTFVPGREISEKDFSPERCRAAGEILARLHIATAQYDDMPDPAWDRFAPAQLDAVWRRVDAEQPKIASELDPFIRPALAEALDDAGRDIPRAIIHGDLFPENLLFDGPRVAGLIDFEAAAYDACVYDLAVARHALCYVDDAEDVRRGEALRAGYESLRRLTAGEHAAFPTFMRRAALRFTLTRLKDFVLTRTDAVRQPRDYREYARRLEMLSSRRG